MGGATLVLTGLLGGALGGAQVIFKIIGGWPGGGNLTFGLLAKITNIIYYLLNLFIQSCLYSGLGLDDLSLAWPAVVQLMVSFNSESQWILPRVLFFVLSW